MPPRQLTPDLYVSEQPGIADIQVLAGRGIRAIICNRPDGEDPDQPAWAMVEAEARAHGLEARHIPVTPDTMGSGVVQDFAQAMAELPKPVLAYCRTGKRSEMLADKAGLLNATSQSTQKAPASGRLHHRIVIAGAGAGGISVAASLLKRRKGLDIAIIEPSAEHYYQPGWTMVGGGVFTQGQTHKPMAGLMPKGVTWLKQAVAGFDPDNNEVILSDNRRVGYDMLIVSMGNRLAWEGVEGLEQTLGHNGVTSNYHYDHAPYTWELIRGLREGCALFTQPPMPIKCAGAPQKAMYMACSAWEQAGVLGGMDVQFHTAGAVLFGVKEYVPALQTTVDRYGIGVNLGSNLVAVDGPARKATFRTDAGERTLDYAMLHVCPPQKGNSVVAQSPLADGAGYAEVDPLTLQHPRFPNVFALGDGCSAPNAKTAAAVRQQAPVVAENALAALDGKVLDAAYDGYGSCPLTVERGKIVLAEFSYGGKVAPTFPKWLIDGTQPSRLAWLLKEKLMPPLYWYAMLRGHEWLAGPKRLADVPRPGGA